MVDQKELHKYLYTIIGKNGDLTTLQEKLELHPLYTSEDTRIILSYPSVILWTTESAHKVEFDIYINIERRKNPNPNTEVFKVGVARSLVMPLLESGYKVQQKVNQKTLEQLLRL